MLTNPVFRIDLADYAVDYLAYASRGYDFAELERQMLHQLPHVPAGTNVRLMVHGYRPAHSLGWCRTDLIVQIEATDATVISEWMSALIEEEAAA